MKRLVLRVNSEITNGRAAKVYWDSELQEYSVRFFFFQEELTEAEYFTSDKADAIGTAELFVSKGRLN